MERMSGVEDALGRVSSLTVKCAALSASMSAGDIPALSVSRL
jgi:hypothetical protein